MDLVKSYYSNIKRLAEVKNIAEKNLKAAIEKTVFSEEFKPELIKFIGRNLTFVLSYIACVRRGITQIATYDYDNHTYEWDRSLVNEFFPELNNTLIDNNMIIDDYGQIFDIQIPVVSGDQFFIGYNISHNDIEYTGDFNYCDVWYIDTAHIIIAPVLEDLIKSHKQEIFDIALYNDIYMYACNNYIFYEKYNGTRDCLISNDIKTKFSLNYIEYCNKEAEEE
jgi:hypothetical protein